MKPKIVRSILHARRAALGSMFVAAFGLAGLAHGQTFNAGSDGNLGDVIITASTNLDLPPSGKLHFRSLNVNSGATLGFNRNARNTPVFILAQTEVVVNGTINVDGGGRPLNSGGRGGPGGFDGGKPGFGAESLPGGGYGPGAGNAGTLNNCSIADNPQGGSFGTLGIGAPGGRTYGNTFLIPLVGGSGGGGSQGSLMGGGGGGGAVLIAANSRIAINGTILARGGFGGSCNNYGSGGSIRIVSFKVEGSGAMDTSGGSTPNRGFSTSDGVGRIRVDTVVRTGVAFNMTGVSTIGANLLVLPPTVPTLNVLQAAGNPVALDSDPVGFTLPFGSNTNQIVRVQAKDFGRLVPIRVTLTPDAGDKRVFDVEIDNAAANPATLDIPVTVPINTLVTIHCWTR
ncbi:MAG: hypothetical protein ABIQ35_11495 [Verrucomicrobiota bacterium]